MRKLKRPLVTGQEVMKLCASSVRDAGLKDGLLKARKVVEDAELAYVQCGEAAALHTIAGTVGVGAYLSGKQVERVYNGTFVKSKKTRDTYASLKKACSNDICPLCGQGTVRQLDHYLPITEFPVYGLSAINLVPACSDCNKFKLAHAPAAAVDQTMHPYFDDVENERWLFGEVVESAPAAVTFSVRPPAHWGHELTQRLHTHFRIYRLGALYSTHAAVEISNMRHALKNMAVGPDSLLRISQHLEDRAKSCADVHQNSWQRATFDALANSDWFCAGGFGLT